MMCGEVNKTGCALAGGNPTHRGMYYRMSQLQYLSGN